MYQKFHFRADFYPAYTLALCKQKTSSARSKLGRTFLPSTLLTWMEMCIKWLYIGQHPPVASSTCNLKWHNLLTQDSAPLSTAGIQQAESSSVPFLFSIFSAFLCTEKRCGTVADIMDDWKTLTWIWSITVPASSLHLTPYSLIFAVSS